MNKQIFIAEIKTQSPFGFRSDFTFNQLMETAITNGDWVSVHDNALWGCDYETISYVRRNTTKPILAKGFHFTDDDIKKAFDHGADYVLVVDRFPYPNGVNKHKLLYEIHNQNLLEGNLKHYYDTWKDCMFVYNLRDLKTGLLKKYNGLNDFLKHGVWTCQASGIRKPADVNPNVNAFIVGENLMEFTIIKNTLKKYECV